MKTLVISKCSLCNKAIAGGWYGNSVVEKEEILEDTRDWIKRGYLISMSTDKVDIKLEQHEHNCPNHPKMCENRK